MRDLTNIRKGMQVYGPDNRVLGTIDSIEDKLFLVKGQRIPFDAVDRFENNMLYLKTGYLENQQNLKVPVVEERLNVAKRPIEAGAVEINKTVTAEQANVPIELRSEEVHVEERDLPERPLRPGEAAAVFQEGTIRVPVRAEEAIVSKEAVVTGEVAINKTMETQRQNVNETLRKEEVQVNENYDKAAGGIVYKDTQDYTGQASSDATLSNQGYATQQPTTTMASSVAKFPIETGMEVVGVDGDYVGRVKEVRDSNFRVDRKMQPDITVTFGAIQGVNGDQVILNVAGDQVDLI